MKCESYVLQEFRELDAFANLLLKENVKSYLEVGCKFGGSLWRIGNRLPRGSRIVAADLPQGDTSFKDTKPHLIECVEALKKNGYDAHLILGDSTDPQVVEQVYALGPFDAVFIDANHTKPYVRKDFENYGKITKLIAFHDINFFRPGGLPPHKKPIEVREVWDEIRKDKRHVVIITKGNNKDGGRDNGIGVLWTT